MSRHLIAASILAAATVFSAGAANPATSQYYSYAANDCSEYNPYCVLYDYPYSTYHHSGAEYPYWRNDSEYWAGRRYWRDGRY